MKNDRRRFLVVLRCSLYFVLARLGDVQRSFGVRITRASTINPFAGLGAGRQFPDAGQPLSAIYENGFSVKAHLLNPAPPVDGAAGPVSPSLLVMVAGVARAARGRRRKIPLSIYPRM